MEQQDENKHRMLIESGGGGNMVKYVCLFFAKFDSLIKIFATKKCFNDDHDLLLQ